MGPPTPEVSYEIYLKQVPPQIVLRYMFYYIYMYQLLTRHIELIAFIYLQIYGSDISYF